jgi:ferredoxin
MFNKDKPVEVIIDKEKCTQCGLCVNYCAGKYLLQKDQQIKVNPDSMFGCVQCGHCMMVCPTDAIKVRGEGISEENLYPLENRKLDYNELYSFLMHRRSVRKYKKQEIEKETLDKLLEASSTGPVSVPPFELKVLVINGSEKVQTLADDLTLSFEQMLKKFSPFKLKLYKPLMGKMTYKMFAEFIYPLINKTVELRKKGIDILFYNAPAIIIFYSSEGTEKEDAIIASTLTSVVAETLGLGSCMIGSVPAAFNHNVALKEKYGIGKKDLVSMGLILGYPEKHFEKGIKRQFKETRYL